MSASARPGSSCADGRCRSPSPVRGSGPPGRSSPARSGSINRHGGRRVIGGATVEETVMRRISVATLAAAGLCLGSPAAAYEARGAAAVLAGPTILKEGPTIVPLRLTRSLAPPGARAELVIEGLAYDASPGTLYEV